MKRTKRSLTTFLILALLLTLSGVAVAQEATSDAPPGAATEALPVESPTISATDAPTLAPTEPPTERPTTPTDVPTLTPVLSGTEATAESTATPSEPIPSPLPSPTSTAQTFPPEPALAAWFSDSFDTGAAPVWMLDGNWVAENGALKLVVSGGTAKLVLSPVRDAVVQLRVLLGESSGVQISLQDSGNGGYAALLRSDGQIGLYRAGALLQVAQAQPFALADWHTLRLSAVSGIVRVSVDANEMIALQDTAPLPPGTMNLTGFAAGDPLVDDVTVLVPPDQLPPPTALPFPTLIPTATTVIPTPEVTPVVTSEATAQPTLAPRIPDRNLPPVRNRQSLTTQGVTFIVNTIDDNTVQILSSNCDTPGLPCALRQAIQRAEEVSGPDTIQFAIPGAGVHTIRLVTTLQIRTSVIIDGTTQPGYENNGGRPLIDIQPVNPDSGGADGLNIYSSDTYDASLSVTIRGLAVHGFTGAALNIGDGQNHLIENNFIGTDATGMLNRGNNVGIALSARNSIIRNNVISGNTSSGISLRSSGPRLAINNSITGNAIGTNFGGTAAIPNQVGIDITYGANNNTIGGTTPADRNIISGNIQNGISILGSSNPVLDVTGTIIQGNYIGTNADGTGKLGNGINGIYIQQSGGNTIGGTNGVTLGGGCAGACNLISGNQYGINIYDNSGAVTQGNTIAGNFIGTDNTGTSAVPNATSGIYIFGNANIIGGTTSAARNVISGNKGHGITFTGTASSGNQVLGNFIGTDTTGVLALGNQYYGVFIRGGASGNRIGNKTAGGMNRIAFNGTSGSLAGVGVETGTNNLISTNEIYGNNGPGIDLLPEGITPNDSGDGDTGANELQNFPDLTVTTQATTVISGTLNSKPSTTYRIELYSNPSCGDYREGRTSLGSMDVTTDGSGNTPAFAFDVRSVLPGSTGITAIAIDPDGNTSEFSACKTALADLSIMNEVAGTALQGATLTYTLTVNNSAGPSDAHNTLVTDPLPAQVTFVSAASSQGTCSHNPSNHTVTCDLGTLTSGGSASITINVTINTALTTGTFTNTASVTSDTPDPAPGNNSASQPTTLPLANLALSQTAAPNGAVVVGGTLTYTFKTTNLGPVAATALNLHDVLPANVTFLSATAGAGTCTPGNGVVDCTLANLAKGAVWTVTVAVSPNIGTQNTLLTNTGSVSAEQVDLLPGNNTAVSNVKANTPPVPPVPALLSPANGAPTNNTTPTLTWNPALYAVGYEVQIAANSTFTSGLQTSASALTSYTPSAGLAEGTYYWRVRAKNILDVYGSFSALRSFTIDTTALTEKAALLTPAAGAFISTVRPSFTWKAVAGAKQYRIQADDDPQFGSPVIDQLVAGTTYATPVSAAPLPQGLYYWQVLAIDPAGNEGSNWSDPRQFTVFIGTAPANGSFNTTGKPTFSWAAVTGTTSYSLEIATDSDFTTYVMGYPLPLNKTTYTPATTLPNETTLYWRVLRSGETPVSTAYRTLFIAAAPPAPTPADLLNPTLLNIATPTLVWTPITPPNGVTLLDYEIQLARTAAFTTGLTTLTSPATNVTTPALADGLWYRRVRARFSADALPGTWSTTRSFTIDTVAPEPPKLSYPAFNAVISTEQPRLAWVASPGATSYRVDIADNAAFANPIVQNQTATTNSFTATCSNSNAVVLRWMGFQNFGIVRMELDNRGGVPAKLTNFRINWNQRLPGVLTLARVSVFAAPGDPGAVIIWQASSPAQDATPPTVGKTKTGWPPADPAWVQDAVIPAHTVVPVYLDFDGVASTLDTIGMVPQDFNNTTFDVDCPGTGLAQGHYWWRVRAVDAAGNTSGDSLTSEFTIFIGTAPADGVFNAAGKPTFTWAAVAGATGYRLEIATDSAFMNPVDGYPLPLNKTTYTPTIALPSGTLYWRVVPNGETPLASAYRTLFMGAAPAAPMPSQPLNGAVVHTATPQLTWSAITPPSGVALADYEIQLARNATFTTGLVTLTSSTPDVTTGTLATGLWYWRVRARFGPGALPGAWSATRSFTVKIP